tara:strand:+ start:3723 stop:4559 length:837 start_codon:yes stop_codon:yes gene_type:complete
LDKYYYELTVKPNLYYELFVDLAVSLTSDAIEEFDETIIIRSEDPLDNVLLGIQTFAKELSSAFSIEIFCESNLIKKENQDWIKLYQQSVQAIKVGRFYIHPSWNEPMVDMVNIIIDPTLAFGSGHHETTKCCLSAVEKYVQDGNNVVDIGTGSGILGIAASKCGAIVDICDTDIVAVNDAIINFERNETPINKYWEGSANTSKKNYDVVIANIVADVLVMIASDIKKITKKDGIIVLSGIMEQYKTKVLKKFKDCEVLEEFQENEWVTLIVKKANNE